MHAHLSELFELFRVEVLGNNLERLSRCLINQQSRSRMPDTTVYVRQMGPRE